MPALKEILELNVNYATFKKVIREQTTLEIVNNVEI